MKKTVREIFNNHTGYLIHKQDHYFEIYDQFFSKYIGTEVIILEIGISHGGSFQVWKKYFGDKARIFAVDILPECKKLEEENVKIFIGSQEDKKFLKKLISQVPQPHIIIDDGGHTMKQQITTFDILYNHLQTPGIYLCEDTCTSYWYEFGGGLRKRNTFIEYSKRLIDHINSWHFKNKKVKVDEFTRTTNAIHFYDSMVFFEKSHRQKPTNVVKGEKTITHGEDPLKSRRTLLHQIIKKIQSV